ncbi:hypothetical protein KY289_006100 [Solanum tuberosum]|nr:hypothetical protein KY289_006100 [Solanum tuberosum]
MELFQSPADLDQYKRKLGFEHPGQITIKFKIRDKFFLITAVYARCTALERLELWEAPGDLAGREHYPWVVGGDFNVVLNEKEKLGGLQFTQNEALDFASCITSCALSEIRTSCSKFTWWNGRIEEDCIFKRLDMIVVNQEFMDIFPSSEVHHLIRHGSDHAPLHMTCDSVEGPTLKPFQFLNFWSKHKYFKKIVEDNWCVDFVGNPFVEFQAKLKKMKKALSVWSRTVMGISFNKLPQ